MEQEVNKCERCKTTQFADTSDGTGTHAALGWAAWSVDIWAFITLYDEKGETDKTGEELATDDYVVLCPECWGEVKELWTEFMKSVRTKGNQP